MSIPFRPSINIDYDQTRRLQRIYPPMPSYNQRCTNNIEYTTLPEGFPMHHTILGPNSLKKLYEGPWYYPPNRISVPAPIGMYDVDTGTAYQNGVRRTYGAKLYPLTHRSPHEVREYADGVLEMPDLFKWTNYHTVSDGAWGR